MGFNLQKITGERKTPFSFATMDIETMNWTKFIVLGHYDGKTYNEFRQWKRYFKFLKTEKTTTIFAHFGGKFDFLFVLKESLKNEKIKIINIIPRGSSILCLTIRIGRTDCNFRDSSALLPFSLKSITENFRTNILKGNWDHTKTKGWSPELSKYLKADCISLYESIEKFYQWPLIKKAGPAFTVASQAMRVFRTFLKDDLYNPGKHVNEYSKKAYFGGRTEIFKPFSRKGQRLFEYDVNSLYPYVMRENFFPIGRGSFTYCFERGKLGIYEARVSAPKIHIPVLGILHDKKYIFPIGDFEGTFTSEEINYAKTLGYTFQIKRGIFFEQKEKLFDKFINELYSIRLISEKNSVNDIIAKLLMNSSYGRFGMNLERENITFDLDEGVKEFRELQINNKTIQLYKKPVTLESFTHTAIAAFVTSYARIHMHKIMHPIAEHVYYTDTDSIFTTKELKSGKALGELKLEAEYESGAVFLLPKTYFALGTKKKKIAMKGFDKKKIDLFTLEDFKNALEGDLKRFKITNEPKFASLKQALSKNKIVTMTKASEKQLKALYNKRIIYKSKSGEFRTKPIQLRGESNGN